MAEPTLSMQYEGFCAQVGFFLGYGVAPGSWDAAQTAEIDLIVQSGYRHFLFPAVLEGEVVPHLWSFLSPIEQLDTSADDFDYDLPDDFQSMVGMMTRDESGVNVPVRVVGEGQIRAHRAALITNGKPLWAGVVAKEFEPDTGQRFELLMAPTPDGTYQYHYRYNRIQNALAAGKYPIGGPVHNETLIESCLDIAESRSDDNESTIHGVLYRERLVTSVGLDRRLIAPEWLGYNGDPSSGQRGIGRGRYYSTYNNIIWGEFAP